MAPGTAGSWSSRRDWFLWLIRAGRGFGKTRSGAEFMRERVEKYGARRLMLIGATAQDARDTMIEGVAGLLAVSSPAFMPVYNPSLARVTWPNGAIALVRSAEEPNRIRGPESDTAWCDELAAWKYLEDSWDNLMLGLRQPTAHGVQPACVATTTPKPLKKLKEIMALPSTEEVVGSTFENVANLARLYVQTVIAPYIGTQKGRQELYAQMLTDVEGALWKRSWLDDTRLTWSAYEGLEDEIARMLGGVDPSGGIAETGIVVGGQGSRRMPHYHSPRPEDVTAWQELGSDLHLYVLDDMTANGTPEVWGQACEDAYHKWQLSALVAERNQGGKMVASTIRRRDRRISIKEVTAAQGKHTRAEPISQFWERGLGHMVGHFARLEDELCEWVPGAESPNRLDAMVWMATLATAGGRSADVDFSSSLSQLNRDMQTPSTWRRR